MSTENIPFKFKRFPQHWDVMPFNKAFFDETGGNPKIKRNQYREIGKLPIIDQGQKYIGGYIDDLDLKCKAPTPCILFGDHTKVLKYVDFPFALGADGVKVLVPNEKLNSRFSFYYLNQLQLPDDAGYSRHFKFLKESYIPIPPIEEQKRITAILNKADTIRHKRRQAIKLTDKFLRSVFLDMFGDPVSNPENWYQKQIESTIEDIKAGWSIKGSNRDRMPGEWGVLKVSAVTSGRFLPEECKVVAVKNLKREMVTPRKGDLLFSRANTRELVAATCLVERDHSHLFLSDKLWKIIPKQNVLRPEFLKFVLSHPRYRDKIREQATGTSGSMLNVSQDKVKQLTIPVPPLAFQEKFSKILWKIYEIRNQVDESIQNATVLFNSITQRAFRGEL